MKVKIRGKVFEIDNVNVKGFEVFRGLMFSSREKSRALLFNIKGGLHSYFVFFPFLVLWLDSSNKVLEYKIVKPFSFYVNSRTNFSKILEIPINRRYNHIVNFLVRRENLSTSKGLKRNDC